MPVLNHPFRKLGGDSNPRPYLDIVLINPHTGIRLNTFGLIDTGADECALPAAFAPVLGHNLKKGQAKYIIGAGGPAKAYAHTMVIKIPKFSTNKVPIDFIEGLNTVLLGVKSFLSHFRLIVNYHKNVFSLKK